MRMIPNLAIAALVMAGSLSFVTESIANQGEKDYNRFLCDHCHGKDGKSPKTDIVPVIAGKSADFIVKEAGDILSGVRKGRGVVMHAKYYSIQATSESCDVGPSPTELQGIANWLSKL